MSLKQGIKQWGKKGEGAAFDEMKQLHECIVFRLIDILQLTPEEWQHALELLIFLKEKQDGRIKGCVCADGCRN